MEILKNTIEKLLSLFERYELQIPSLKKIVIGLGYTGVEVARKEQNENYSTVGLCYTLTSIINKPECTKLENAGNLTQKSTKELLYWCLENPSIKKIVGIATLNAVSQYFIQKFRPYFELQEDLFEFLRLNNRSKVLFIGYLRPLVEKAMKFSKNIIVVEDHLANRQLMNRIKFSRDINDLNNGDKNVDFLICTGTAILNETIDRIIDEFKNKVNKFIILGPTVSFIPDTLFEAGISIVGGLNVNDNEKVLKVIQEGGGTKDFKKYSMKYYLINKLNHGER